MMFVILYVIASLVVYYDMIAVSTEDIKDVKASLRQIYKQTRRILQGTEVGNTRPYMVYLRPSAGSDPSLSDSNWLCGGVIIHPEYILTSAACIEDAELFYIVSGTHTWVNASEKNNACINNGQRRAIWKCVPKNYVYDGRGFNNLRWIIHDIAVVKVEHPFNFKRRIKGCDFVPQQIAYNNRSLDYEKPGTMGSLAGWGSTAYFQNPSPSSSAVNNSQELLETESQLITIANCKRTWPARYHHIIDNQIICGRESSDAHVMSDLCSEHEVNCKELVYSKETSSEPTRRMIFDPELSEIHTARHVFQEKTRRQSVIGGFCENDHGGPFVVGHGKTSVVVGIMSACQTRALTHRCFGPFLYTSVYQHRNLISCAIEKEVSKECRRYFRTAEAKLVTTTYDWSTFSLRQSRNEKLRETYALRSGGQRLYDLIALDTAKSLTNERVNQSRLKLDFTTKRTVH